LLEAFPETRVLNTYGPTEATNTVSLVNIDKAVVDRYSVLPVGYPKYTSEILIENDLNDPSTSGEIIIVGKNVSIGYLRNLELTKERFFLHNGHRAYRTGDFGYIREGLLFFNGRKDDQVKLHGFRIELNEIDCYIANLDFVEAVVTLPLRTEKVVKRIVTFVKLKSGYSRIEAPANILSYLKDRLPGYMIPSEVKVIAEFPYNNNHKVDKTKLLDWYSGEGITTATDT
jgi:D-alanine--poly(phosphoribitol) ligase subunit 1